MQIVHVISSMDPDAGGPPAVAARLAAGQASLGHEVSIVSRDRADRHDVIRHSIEDVPLLDKINLRMIEPGGKLERIFSLRSKGELSKIAGDCDIFHLHGVWDPMLVATAKAADRAVAGDPELEVLVLPTIPIGRSSHHLNIRIPGVRNETLLMRLDQGGVAASAGSACESGAATVSHVLEAMGTIEEFSEGALRFSFGSRTTEMKVMTAAAEIKHVITELRSR